VTGNISILQVDDHKVLRRGLLACLQAELDLSVVADVGNSEEAVIACEQFQPDVVVMDIDIDGETGFEAARRIRDSWPEVHVIF